MALSCPSCGKPTKVLATRPGEAAARRKRRCPSCKASFWTEERLSVGQLQVRKASTGDVVAFSRGSVRRNIEKAAVAKIPGEVLERIVDHVVADAFAAGDGGIVDSSDVAGAVMAQLQQERPETHVRFALSYKARRDREASQWRTATDVRRWLRENYAPLAGRRAEDTLRQVVKSNGRRQDFDLQKLERSIGVASKGCGDSEAVRRFASDVADKVRTELQGQPLVTSGQLAAEVLRVLRRRDPIAYLRYASTAKNFGDPSDYDDEAAGLERDTSEAS
jgi:transcriptional regulator NrdR family protein